MVIASLKDVRARKVSEDCCLVLRSRTTEIMNLEFEVVLVNLKLNLNGFGKFKINI